MHQSIDLPALPNPSVLAFDEAREIKGYTKSDLTEYAIAAIELERKAPADEKHSSEAVLVIGLIAIVHAGFWGGIGYFAGWFIWAQ